MFLTFYTENPKTVQMHTTVAVNRSGQCLMTSFVINSLQTVVCLHLPTSVNDHFQVNRGLFGLLLPLILERTFARK